MFDVPLKRFLVVSNAVPSSDADTTVAKSLVTRRASVKTASKRVESRRKYAGTPVQPRAMPRESVRKMKRAKRLLRSVVLVGMSNNAPIAAPAPTRLKGMEGPKSGEKRLV